MTAVPSPLPAPALRPVAGAADREPFGRRGPSSRLEFRPDVEGLRGVAILLVVLYHAGVPGFGGGFVGVDVFFVLSGFLITRLLLAELACTGTISFAGFYARRMRRLLPAAALSTVVTLALATWLYPPLRAGDVADAAFAATAFFSNVHFAHAAADYFRQPGGPSPLLHTWSLSVEEQFYLAWPTLLLLAGGRRANVRRIAWMLGALSLVSLALSWYYTTAERPTAFYGTPMRAWEFALGALVVLLPRSGADDDTNQVRRAAVALLATCGIAMIALAAHSFSETTQFPGMAALLPVAGTALVLATESRTHGTWAGRLLATRPLQWVGRHSYGWYLWHWPLLILGAELLPARGKLARVGLVMAGLALAAITRIVIEDPVRHGRLWRDRPRRVVATGLAAIGALLLGTTALARGGARSHGVLHAVTLARADWPRQYHDGCVPDFTDARVRVCEYGTRDAPLATVAVFGDSHAAHWMPALEVIAARRRWRLLVVTKRACPAAEVTVWSTAYDRRLIECDSWRADALDSLAARRPTLVLLASSMQDAAGAPYGARDSAVAVGAWARGFDSTLARLHRASVPVLVIRDTPRAPESIPACLERAAWQGHPLAACDFRAERGRHAPLERATTRVVAGFPDDRTIDLTGAICPGGRCMAMRGDTVLYRDDSHLTTRSSIGLAPALEAAIDGAAALGRR